MNAIRESVRHEIDVTFQAEERARIREEEGLEEEEEEEENEGPDPVPAITRAHFEVCRVPGSLFAGGFVCLDLVQKLEARCKEYERFWWI